LGPLGRAPRTAASALLLATIIGVAGTTGISGALAVDPPATVAVVGLVVDQNAVPLPHLHLVLSEELPPDGGLAGFRATTGADGSFSVPLYAWGTIDAPADVTIKAPADETVTVAINSQCSRTYTVTLADDRELALGDGFPPKPLDVTAATTVVGEICGTTATPPPDSGSGNGAGHSRPPRLTPPPTDGGSPVVRRGDDRLGIALVLGFAAGLAGAGMLFATRPGARRRR
jgi:hypothetical protein